MISFQKSLKFLIYLYGINQLLSSPTGTPSESDSLLKKNENRLFNIHQLTYSGKSVSLARKEFNLLFLLMSIPGKVFSRDEIIQNVWNDVVVGDRTIDVHVRKIREKIGNHHIKTIKGVGYKFDL